MNNKTYATVGRLFFAIALLAIGIIHIIIKNLPVGLLPVPAGLPGRVVLVYLSGAALIIAGLLICSKKFLYSGALLAAIIWLLYLLALHLPKLFITFELPEDWTPTFEVVIFISGAAQLMAIADPAKDSRFKLSSIARYAFALALSVFFVLHLKYSQFIEMLIPAWLPFHFFWANLVTLAFLLASISLFIGKMLRLCMLLLAAMFFIWFWILHLPRVIGDVRSEPEWTSMFVVLAAAGVALLMASVQTKKVYRNNT